MDPDAIRSALSIKQSRAASGNRGPVRLITPGVPGFKSGVPLIKR
jgi:hypothetical protein